MSNSGALALGQSNDNVLVTLDRWEDGQVNVWNVEYIGKGIRNRVTFSDGRPVQDVFVAELADRVREVLASLDRHTRIFSDAEFELTMSGGVTLRGLRVMIAQAKDNFDRVLLRFREVSGPISGLFQMTERPGVDVVSKAQKVAVAALSDIVLPVCDLADGLRETATRELAGDGDAASLLEERLEMLQEQSETVRLYMHLLMRYIEGTGKSPDAAELERALAGLSIGRS